MHKPSINTPTCTNYRQCSGTWLPPSTLPLAPTSSSSTPPTPTPTPTTNPTQPYDSSPSCPNWVPIHCAGSKLDAKKGAKPINPQSPSPAPPVLSVPMVWMQPRRAVAGTQANLSGFFFWVKANNIQLKKSPAFPQKRPLWVSASHS